MPASRYWTNQDRVQDLVIFLTLSRTHIDDFPLKVYKEQKALVSDHMIKTRNLFIKFSFQQRVLEKKKQKSNV